MRLDPCEKMAVRNKIGDAADNVSQINALMSAAVVTLLR